MRKMNNTSVYRYTLIACLSIMLLLGHSFKLHMHVQHTDIAENSSFEHTSANHIVKIHVSSSLHDTNYDSHHRDDFQDHHNYADIDISSSELVKVSNRLNSFVFLLLVISFVLSVPLLQRVHKKYIAKTKHPSKYYLLHPPLRAPPL